MLRQRLAKATALLLTVAVFVVLVSPFVDLDPTTLCSPGLLPAIVGVVYRVPDPRAHLAVHPEQFVFSLVKPLTDITCSRLC